MPVAFLLLSIAVSLVMRGRPLGSDRIVCVASGCWAAGSATSAKEAVVVPILRLVLVLGLDWPRMLPCTWYPISPSGLVLP